MSCAALLSIRIERRRIAVAIFSGLRLEYHQVRELSSAEDEAKRTTQRFINWLVDVFDPALVVIEDAGAKEGTRRAELAHVVAGTLMLRRVPRVRIEPREVLGSFAVPGLRTKKSLRVIAESIWPELPARHVHPATYDAAALGLHVQMKELFVDQ
jgi:hypothetical protein